MNNSALQVNGLSIGYRSANTVLFENVTLSLPHGQLTCFMGPNGVGKSTLIKVLAGLMSPLRGQVSIYGEKKIALVLTDKISTTNMTVWDLVSYGRYPYLTWKIELTEYDTQVIEQAIADAGIRELRDKKVEELSDGQYQLAMIARALAQETPLLLLDEPTAHLDLNHRVEIMKLLLTLVRKRNKTVLVATHELDLALQMADHIWLATADRKIKNGIPEDLVLDGSFDDTFQFKGFDLKSGKVQHEPFRSAGVRLVGEGYGLLWTKNALERNGYVVSDEDGRSVEIAEGYGKIRWRLLQQEFTSLEALLDQLGKTG